MIIHSNVSNDIFEIFKDVFVCFVGKSWDFSYLYWSCLLEIPKIAFLSIKGGVIEVYCKMENWFK